MSFVRPLPGYPLPGFASTRFCKKLAMNNLHLTVALMTHPGLCATPYGTRLILSLTLLFSNNTAKSTPAEEKADKRHNIALIISRKVMA